MENQYFYTKLIKLYPDKTIQNLNYYPSLYSKLCSLSREKEMSLKELLESMGFKYKLKRGITSSFDFFTAKRLISEFRINQTELARYLGTTRQAVSNKITRGTSGGNWKSNELNEEEIELIVEMVKNNKFNLSEEGLFVSIRNNFHDVCVIFARDNEMKVVFDLPGDIDFLLKKSKYHIFSEIDFDIKANLIAVSVFGIPMAKVRGHATQIKIDKQCELRNITHNDYFRLHGYEGHCDSRMKTDKEIEHIIKKYVTRDNFVFLPHTSEDYFSLVNRASRSNMTIDEFIEFFGFIKVDSRRESSYIIKIEQYAQEIRELVIGDGNQVYIKTDSNLYRKLYSFAKRREISFDRLLMEMGFERVYNPNDIVEFENFSRNFDKNHPDIDALIKELEDIQGDLERTISSVERINRCTTLVSKLKKLYRFKCQLCSEESGFPLIEKLDGSYYVEVHHIAPLSLINTSSKLEIDDETLDTFKNAIVVCPFHHKMLHYHHGGFEKFTKQEDGIYFISTKGSTIKVQLNYHL